MRTLHLAAGWLFAAIFAGTGAWMRYSFPEAHHDDHGMRMMFRASHIYILLSALIHLAIGVQWRPSSRPTLQRLGSAALFIATLLFLTSFFTEPAIGEINRPLVSFGAYFSVAGIALSLLAARGSAKDG